MTTPSVTWESTTYCPTPPGRAMMCGGHIVALVPDTARPDRPGRPAALLLTGGTSRRMGRDKATLPVNGTPLAERTATLLAQVADPVVEVGPGWTGLVAVREEPAGQGPLAAMAAGWAYLSGAAGGGSHPW